MLADLHAHTISSPDAYDTVETLGKTAAALGVDVLAITDHCDAMATMPFFEFWGMDRQVVRFDEKQARKRFFEAKERLGGAVKLLYGIELGEPHLRRTETRELLLRQQYDVVLGSVHTFIGDADPDMLDYDAVHPNDVVRHYLQDLYETVALGGIDVLSHIEYPLRYLPLRPGYEGSYRPFEEELRAVLRLAAQKGIALEINGKSRKNGRFILEPFVIDWYREAGGEYLSYGSDAHRASQLLRNYAEARAYALDRGMKYFVYFDKRRPVPYRID